MAMEVQEIFPGVYELFTWYGHDTPHLVSQDKLPHALWYVAGPEPALLDPGPTIIMEEALEAIRRLGHDPNQIAYAIPSHIHVDHAGAAGWLVKNLPKVKVVIHASGARFLLDPTRLIQGTAQVFGADWESSFGPMLPVPQDRLIGAEDGQSFAIGGRKHRIVHLPGHSLDHIGVYDEEVKALYAGHALGQYPPTRRMPDPPATLPFFDPQATLDSCARVRALNGRYLVLGHFGIIHADPSYIIGTTELVTRKLEDIVRRGTEQGLSKDAIEEQVKVFLYAKPEKAEHQYAGLVQSYQTYFERQKRARG